MNREVADTWCQRGILALVLAILVLGPVSGGAVRTAPFLVIQGLTVAVMVLWAARFWLTDRPKLLWPPICWAVLAFTLYAVARYATADIEYVARQELIRVLVYACLFFAILNNLHRQETTQILVFTLLFLAMAISFLAFYQFLTGSEQVWHFVHRDRHRGSGTYVSPNHLGGFLELLLPLGLAYTLVGRLKPVTKVLLGYASLAILAGIAVTVSRGSWISTGLALTLLFGVLLFQRAYRLPALVLLVVLLGAGAWLAPRSFSLMTRWHLLKEEVGDKRAGMRYALWQPAVQIWRDNPWWGAGPAHFDYRFCAYRPADVQLRPDRAHNDYLNMLADWGVVGTALVVSAWVLLGWGAARTWRFVRGNAGELGGKPGSNRFAFVLGASFGLLAILFHSAVDFNMHIPANAIVAVTLMALLSSHLRFATERYWAALGLASKGLATALVLAFAVYLGQQDWRHSRESLWLERASRAPECSPGQAELLAKAFAIEPMDEETAYGLGEASRMQSLEGRGNYGELGTNALSWFQRCLKLNPLDSAGFLRYGMCLDWLDRQNESAPFFSHAEELDPNGYFTVANIGLHYMQSGEYAAARPWFERSLRLKREENPIANSYLDIATERLLEAATNEFSVRPAIPPP
jgi:O-antigen ligase